MTIRASLCFAGLLSGVLLAGSIGDQRVSAQTKPPKQDYNSGEYLYRTFCASCHGDAGHGDGPAAVALRAPLPDLTRVTARAGGAFPRENIRRIVDGRQPVPGHDIEMPRWGRVLRSVEGDNDRAIQQRIDALVKHVESMQRP